MTNLNFISILVPVHRIESTKNLATALENQAYPKNKYEIIFVGCKKNSMKKIFSTNKRIIYFDIDSQWPDAKNNFGIKKAKGEIIAITSDDCIPNNDWLEKINLAFDEDKEISAVTGKTIKNKGRIFDHGVEHLKGILGPASNMAFKKNKLIEIGGYDENFRFYREETVLHFKLLNNNEKIVFKENVIVFHPLRKSSPLNIFKELEYIRTEILLSKQYPLLFKKYLGFPVAGLLKQSFFSWAITALIFGSVIQMNYYYTLFFLAVYFTFRYFVNFRKYSFEFGDFIMFSVLALLRDLTAPFYSIYYYFTTNNRP
ncbi:MAG: glycosyltransferase family 2 protein [archaeon]|nr:glycosyltransferase family 2 protein [archaeon]